MLRLIALALFLVCAGIASAQLAWRKYYPGLNPYNYIVNNEPQTDTIHEWTNTSGSPQLHAIGGYYYYVQRVTGSNESPGPTWESPFDVLSNETEQLAWEVTATVPAGGYLNVKVNILVDEGAESWYYGPPFSQEMGTPEVHSRSLLWKTLTGSSPYYYIFKSWE